MKQWEVMRLLEENPTKVYEAKLVRNPWVARVRTEAGCYKFTVHDANDGDQIIQSLVEEMMTLDLDWQLVRQPVPWQEAIQAWADGKKVRYKYPDDKTMYPFEDTNQMMSIEKIKVAAWYVEERE